MAKNTRRGLGRGLNSLIGGSTDQLSANPRTRNRETLIYDERTDRTYTTGNIPAIQEDVVTDPSQTGRLQTTIIEEEVVEEVVQKENVSRETIVEKVEAEIVEEEPIEEKTEHQVAEKVDIEASEDEESGINEVAIEEVFPNPDQPRTNFNKDELKELSNSIKREGLIQPILVRQTPDGYQIIAGERRWQAAKLAGISKIPIQIRNVSDEKALELALIENIQRSDLNPIEEAYGYRRLMERNKMTQADIAQAMSKGRSTIANALRLLELPEEAQQMLFEDKITAGHARAILSVPSKEGRLSLTRKLEEGNLSVRETEALARLLANKGEKSASQREPIPAVYKSVARTLKEVLKTQVKVKTSKGKNKIEIEFKDEKDLERIFNEIVPE